MPTVPQLNDSFTGKGGSCDAEYIEHIDLRTILIGLDWNYHPSRFQMGEISISDELSLHRLNVNCLYLEIG